MLTPRQQLLADCLRDPGRHRAALTRKPLYWPQTKAVRQVEEAIARADAQTLAIRSARQTMKNECSALVHVRFLVKHERVGGSIVRTAPTYSPQLVNSKLRLEREINDDPLIDARKVRRREGNIVQYGQAMVQFLSTAPTARVEGATASKLLDIDEAHLVDKGGYHERFGPMAAFFAPPTVFWGVAGAKDDLLYEQLCHLLGHPPDPGVIQEKGVLQYPAELWCELRPEYARSYAERVRLLGEDHPVILTQYRLVDIDSVGGFLKARHLKQLDSGDHPALLQPRKERHLEYVAVIDIAGEDEEEIEDALAQSSTRRDSTVCYLIEVDHGPKAVVNGIPRCRAAAAVWWTGKQLAADPTTGLPGQQELLLKLLKTWNVSRCVVDARGVGAQLAGYLGKRHKGVLEYAASSSSVSEDAFSFLSLLNNGQLSLWKRGTEPKNPVGEKLAEARAETMRQCGWVGYEIVGHDSMRIVKPKGGGHIDHVKALSYLPRALALPRPAAPGVIHQPYSMVG